MTVKIDTRPLLVVIFSRWWRFLVYIGLAFFLYYFYKQPPPAGLSPEGFRALAVFFACLILWVFHLLPLSITGLFALVAPAVMGVMPAKKAFTFFGAEPVFFILGVFILAAALLRSGLSTRIGLLILKRAGHSPRRLILQIMIASTLLSFFMSEHAVAAMMFPLVIIIAESLEYVPYGGSYGRLLFLAMAWGCVVGGIATMLGGGRVPLAIGIFQERGLGTINFLEWTLAVIPIVLVLFVLVYVILTRYYSIDVESVEKVDELITEKVRELGKIRMEEYFLLALTLGAVVAWIFLGDKVGMATISILAVVLLFMFRVVEWKQLQESVDWGIILMYGGAVGISSILNSTGAGEWLTKTYVLPYIHSPFMLIALLSLVTILLTEAMSHSAVVAVIVPIGISVATSFGMNPKAIIYAVGSASGLAYALPMSTPSVAMAYSSGYIRFQDIAVPSVVLTVVSWGLLLLTAKFWWPLLGVKAF
jgi:sodium-dependent dicarboxylate transporter 2/3/5